MIAYDCIGCHGYIPEFDAQYPSDDRIAHAIKRYVPTYFLFVCALKYRGLSSGMCPRIFRLSFCSGRGEDQIVFGGVVQTVPHVFT